MSAPEAENPEKENDEYAITRRQVCFVLVIANFWLLCLFGFMDARTAQLTSAQEPAPATFVSIPHNPSNALDVYEDMVRYGRQVFGERCAVCHTMDPKQVSYGPQLNCILGRRIADPEQSFGYSEDLRKIGARSSAVWDIPALYSFIAYPRQFVEQTSMPFKGLGYYDQINGLNKDYIEHVRATKRADRKIRAVIHYLNSTCEKTKKAIEDERPFARLWRTVSAVHKPFKGYTERHVPEHGVLMLGGTGHLSCTPPSVVPPIAAVPRPDFILPGGIAECKKSAQADPKDRAKLSSDPWVALWQSIGQPQMQVR